MPISNKRKVTYNHWQTGFGGIPAIILQGKFLTQFGFTVGSYFKVHYGNGLITIADMNHRLAHEVERNTTDG